MPSAEASAKDYNGGRALQMRVFSKRRLAAPTAIARGRPNDRHSDRIFLSLLRYFGLNPSLGIP